MKPIILLGCPRDYGGACRESADAALLWLAHGIPVTVLPLNQERPDNNWPRILADHGAKIEPPSLSGIPHWLKDSIVVDFACERVTRMWPELKRRGCRLAHLPCHCAVLPHEHATFRQWPPSAIVCQSEFQKHVLSLQYSNYGVTNMRVIRGAFDERFFPYAPSQHDGHAFVIGAIGRDDTRKWPARIVKCLRAAKQLVPKIRARFLGWTPGMERMSGKLPPWINHMAPGRMSSRAFLADCHVLLCFSDYNENWPRTTLEGFSSGVPVISDARGGYCEQIEQGSTGFLAETEDEATGFMANLAQDEALRLNIARAANRALPDICPPETIYEDWKALFSSLS